jgi:hypothetical protein
MSASNPQEAVFVHTYSKVLVQAWTDASYKKLLKSHPAEALKQYGLTTQKGAKIQIVDKVSGKGNLADQWAAWQKGQSTGTYKLYIPSKPQLGQATDPGMATETTYCCCCCPCCTCT